jgi:hypothetical protein
MMEGGKSQQEGQFQFRGQGQQGSPPQSQGPPPQQQGAVQGSTHYGANVQSNYKPYGKKEDEQERSVDFEPDHTAHMRKEAQQRRNRIIIACVLVAVVIIILAAIGLVIFLVLTYEKTATLEGVEASPDFQTTEWVVTGWVKNLGDDSKSMKDFEIDVGGSATYSSSASCLIDIQVSGGSSGGKIGGGDSVEFRKVAPMKEEGDPDSKEVWVKLYYDDELVETVEIDVARYFGG